MLFKRSILFTYLFVKFGVEVSVSNDLLHYVNVISLLRMLRDLWPFW